MSTTEIYSPGLEGVIAGETAIATVAEGLSYRGYPVTELVEKTTFEEVAFLLLHGDLPNTQQLADFRRRLVANRSLPTRMPIKRRLVSARRLKLECRSRRCCG